MTYHFLEDCIPGKYQVNGQPNILEVASTSFVEGQSHFIDGVPLTQCEYDEILLLEEEHPSTYQSL